MPTLSNLVSEEFARRLERSAESALSASPILHVFSHHDADGISAAAVMTRVLDRAGIDFQLTILKGLEKEFAENLDEQGNYLFMDMGSSHLPVLEEKHMVIVLDHHKPSKDSEKVVHVNTHILGVDGTTDACAGTLAFLFGLALDQKNWDLAPLAMVGMLGDKQHLGGFSGPNRLIVDAAVEKGFVEKKWNLATHGKTIHGSIANSFDPYFVGLSGNNEATRTFLMERGFTPDQEIDALSEEETRRLGSLLALWMLDRKLDTTGIENIGGQRFIYKATKTRLDLLVEYANAAGKEKKGGIGIAALLGAEWAATTSEEYLDGYRNILLKKLGELEKNGSKTHGSIQYIENDTSQLNGPLAGIGMQFILSQDKPTFSVAHKNGRTKVSTRGTKTLVNKGLDLSAVCHLAAEKYGGEGGGHPIASGASVPLEREKEFLDMASEIVAKQLSE